MTLVLTPDSQQLPADIISGFQNAPTSCHPAVTPHPTLYSSMGPEAVPPVPPAHGWSNLQLKGDIAVTSKWPVQVQGSLCWEPAAMGGGEQCTLTLDASEIVEVRSAVRFFNGWFFPRSSTSFHLSPLT